MTLIRFPACLVYTCLLTWQAISRGYLPLVMLWWAAFCALGLGGGLSQADAAAVGIQGSGCKQKKACQSNNKPILFNDVSKLFLAGQSTLFASRQCRVICVNFHVEIPCQIAIHFSITGSQLSLLASTRWLRKIGTSKISVK